MPRDLDKTTLDQLNYMKKNHTCWHSTYLESEIRESCVCAWDQSTNMQLTIRWHGNQPMPRDLDRTTLDQLNYMKKNHTCRCSTYLKSEIRESSVRAWDQSTNTQLAMSQRASGDVCTPSPKFCSSVSSTCGYCSNQGHVSHWIS